MIMRTLRARIALGLLGYTLLLSTMVFAFGEITDDDEGIVIKRALLTQELDDFARHRAADGNYQLPTSDRLRAYISVPGSTVDNIPAQLQSLKPGLHDEVELHGRTVTALVRDIGARRYYMLFDFTQQELAEDSMFWWAMVFSILGVCVLTLVIWWLSGKLLQPVSALATAIDHMSPDEREQRIAVDASSVNEIATIAGAMNRYFERLDGFVSRERAFIDAVSHELRTPIAVIAGAGDVLDADAALPASCRRPLDRIRQTAADAEQLISALLVLAKAPVRLRASGESCRLEELVPEIVEAHEHLRKGKTLQLEVGRLLPSRIDASAQIVQVAIANILRNAIENTDCGRIDISVQPAGVVRISDSGRGMSPEEISRVYAALARRGGGSSGSGIGLQLIRRICEHLGWSLEITQADNEGTLAVLDMRSSLARA